MDEWREGYMLGGRWSASVVPYEYQLYLFVCTLEYDTCSQRGLSKALVCFSVCVCVQT